MYSSIGIRFISLFLLLLAISVLPSLQFKAVFISMLFAHYTMSLYYAKNHIFELTKNIKKNWLIFILFGLSLIYFTLDLHIVAQAAFTILHITISDIYMLNDLVRLEDKKLEKNFLWHSNLSRFLLTASCMFLIFTNYPLLRFLPRDMLLISTLIFIGYFIWVLIKYWTEMSSKTRMTYLLFESSTLLITSSVLLFELQTVIQHLVFYHVLVWLCFPLFMNFRHEKKKEAVNFVIILIVSTTFYLLLGTPALGEKVVIDLNANLPFWASMHFISTIALSRYNPEIVLKLLNKVSPNQLEPVAGRK